MIYYNNNMQTKLLFTPGPLSTTQSVKNAMTVDMGSRDPEFIAIIQEIRQGLLKISQCDDSYTAVLLQGSGSYAVEAVLQTSINQDKDKVLVVVNGSYGERIVNMLKRTKRNFTTIEYPDYEIVRAEDVLKKLEEDQQITHVAMIHSETTSGIINPIDFMKDYKERKIVFIVDAMSSFGAYHIPTQELQIDFLVSSANKCIQGCPGFAFVIAKKESLAKCKGNATSLVLDLYDQEECKLNALLLKLKEMVLTKQFRYTPPTHVLRAFKQALLEFELEGGVAGKNGRYGSSQKLLLENMEKYGFKLYINKEYQGCIISTFESPKDNNWDFKNFYDYLADRNYIIYPGKMTKVPTFRIGSIGEIYPKDIQKLTDLIGDYLNEKNIAVPIKY